MGRLLARNPGTHLVFEFWEFPDMMDSLLTIQGGHWFRPGKLSPGRPHLAHIDIVAYRLIILISEHPYRVLNQISAIIDFGYDGIGRMISIGIDCSPGPGIRGQCAGAVSQHIAMPNFADASDNDARLVAVCGSRDSRVNSHSNLLQGRRFLDS